MRIVVSFIILLIICNTALAQLRCAELFEKQNIPQASVKEFLPKKNSVHYIQMVTDLRQQILSTQSFGVIDFTKILPKDLVEFWIQSFPHDRQAWLQDNQLEVVNPTTGYSENIKKPIETIRSIQIVEKWLKVFVEDVLQTSLNKQGSNLDIRNSFKGQNHVSAGGWHVDGGRVSISLSLRGPGTEILGPLPAAAVKSGNFDKNLEKICKSCFPFMVKPGHAVVFFGTGIADIDPKLLPTVHRTPSFDEDRMLILFRN